MTPELGKQLKDSGFPQGMTDDQYKYWISTRNGTPEMYIMPSLRELIDACGDEFETLERYLPNKDDTYYTMYPESLGHLWHATSQGELVNTEAEGEPLSYRCDSGCCGKKGHGSTPEEAVAKLWLELNKK